ncbi:hypothetical protein NHQ30_011074 [Ciborinia camelliae]|nr:hypothetical protein NHQ30_011074 [Ciborinia camelliae]
MKNWNDSEKRFLYTQYTYYDDKPIIAESDWVDIANEFAIAQPQHLPGGIHYELDPWPKRTVTIDCLKSVITRLVVQKEEERREVAQSEAHGIWLQSRYEERRRQLERLEAEQAAQIEAHGLWVKPQLEERRRQEAAQRQSHRIWRQSQLEEAAQAELARSQNTKPTE